MSARSTYPKPLPVLSAEVVARFYSHVVAVPNHPTGCVQQWGAGVNHRGYGKFFFGGRTVGAHRVAAQLAGLDVSDKVVRHTCDRPVCATPEHLLIGTPADNNADARARGRAINVLAARHASRTHCPRGHRLAGANLRPDLVAKGYRECRVCTRAFSVVASARRWRGVDLPLEDAIAYELARTDGGRDLVAADALRHEVGVVA